MRADVLAGVDGSRTARVVAVSIVVAFAENRGIGYRGGLPWRLPSDLRRFRELTLGGTVLMGRRTYESLPAAHRPLPGRRNVIVSGRAGFDPGPVTTGAAGRLAGAAGTTGVAVRLDEAPSTSVEVHSSIEAALAACGVGCFVIGGGSVYEQALPLAQRVHATIVHGEPPSDTFFPELPSADWQRSELGEELHENGHTFRFAVYDRRR